MKRLFTEELLEWKEKYISEPLLVIGARQVGKTYIIDKFCKENFKNYFKINLMKDREYIELFSSQRSFEEKVAIMETKLGGKFDNEDSIIFIDEIQESEYLIEALKFFCEEEREFHIICAGSLLGVKLHRFSRSFPVGKVRIEHMKGLNFEEFLIATGNERYISVIKEAFQKNEEIFSGFHTKLLDLFQKFLFLGGMPEVIQNYIDNNQDFLKFDSQIIKKIIESYFQDMGKYNTDKKESLRIQTIYKNIPSQLAKENQKFTYAKIDDKDNRKKDYVTALDWLLASELVLPSYMITNLEYPIKGYMDYDSYKLYLNDTGILSNMINLSISDILLAGDYSYKGILVENYVASELSKIGKELFYWSRKGKNKGNAEIDYILQVKTDVIPLEVKAGDDTKSKSLEVYREKYNPKYSIRISTKNFGFQNNIKSVPLYAVFCLNELEEEGK